jgi:hypothetical protein
VPRQGFGKRPKKRVEIFFSFLVFLLIRFKTEPTNPDQSKPTKEDQIFIFTAVSSRGCPNHKGTMIRKNMILGAKKTAFAGALFTF